MAGSTAWRGELALEFAPVVESGEPLDAVTRGAVTRGAVTRDAVTRDAVDSSQPMPRLRTKVVHRYATAPLKVQRPFYPEGPSVCHGVIVHTAGGMVGGDRLHLSLNARPQSHALVTTAAASKAYGKTDAVTEQSVGLQVGQGASLEWFPQELILFDGARYRQHLRVDLAPDAVWVGWEITRLGRTLRGERLTQGEWRSHLEVWQQGRPLWIDPQGIQGGSEMMTSAHGLNHCPVIATFALVGRAVTPDVVTQVRDRWEHHQPHHDPLVIPPSKLDATHSPLPPSQVGVSRLQSGIVCRYRGHSTRQARRWFLSAWQILRPLYLDRPACLPRVWPESQQMRNLIRAT